MKQSIKKVPALLLTAAIAASSVALPAFAAGNLDGFRSDTTQAVVKNAGQTYVFAITPNDAKATPYFTVGNGTVLSTFTAHAPVKQADGKTTYYFGYKCLKDGAAGVYIRIGGETQRVFIGYVGQKPTESAESAAAAKLLSDLHGTYEPLFTSSTMLSKAYTSYWHDYCAAIVGADKADATAATLQSSVTATVMGDTAVNAYKSDPDSARFQCSFTGDVATVTVNGTQISGKDASGKQLFSHNYQYLESETTVDQEGMDFTIFETKDANAGEFKYFAFAPDTPASTYHTEFRYGSNLEDLLKLYSGKYAYWLAAGELTTADKAMYENGISLFCLENMDYTAARTAESLTQISDFVGTWDYYENGKADGDKLSFTVDANGKGQSYYMGKPASNYQVFAYDNDGTDTTKSGIYVSHSEEATPAKYSITTTAAGQTLLTLSGEEDGKPYTISYMKHIAAAQS